MDKESFEKIIKDQPPEIKAKGVYLYNGVTTTANAYKEKPTSATLRDWQESEAALKKYIESITEPQNSHEQTFPSIPAVVDYLHAQGWKISTRTGYNHRDKKILMPRKDGKYYLSDIENYVRTGILSRLDGTKQESADHDLERKKKADADAAEYDARIKKIKAEAIEGKYVFREDMEEELAVQTSAFRNAIHTFIHAQAEDIVSFLSADVSRIPDLIEFLMARSDAHFFRYAEDWEEHGPLIPLGRDADSEDDNTDDDEDEEI